MITKYRIAGLALLALLTLSTSRAQLLIEPSVTASSGTFHYSYQISNQTANDIAIVTLGGLPAAPSAVQNLTSPDGFLSDFDSGLGLLSFFEDTQTFGAGSTVGFFTFDSAYAPGDGSFTALDITGTELTGMTLVPAAVATGAVPEPSSTALIGGVFLCLLIVGRRYRSRFTTKMKSLHLATIAAFAILSVPAFAASHSDAPLIKQDPSANLTDVYAFVGTKYNDPSVKVLNVIVHVHPFCEPGDGVIFDKFADDARYSVHIADPNTGATLQRYDFQFSSINSGYKNPDTILSYGLGTAAGPISDVGDAQQNYVQTYSVTKVSGSHSTIVATGLKCPPPNVGKNTTPFYNDAMGRAVSGATTFAALDRYTRQTVYSASSGESFFAGSREDGFFADAPGIFDFLNVRILDNNGTLADGFGQDGNGVDGFKGYNVLAFALQIPISNLPSIAYTAAFTGPATGVGVYASVSRPRIVLRRTDGDPISSGPWIQVNRMGNPLFNEVLVALRDKDNYNRADPTDDSARFRKYAENPEVGALVNIIHGTSFVTSGRTDLSAVFIPDVLRVNTSTAPVKLAGQAGFSRLSFIGGDTTGGAAGGWPNGRRLGDDVVDIALTAVASGPSYSSITLVGDNVASNDQVYNQVFPYSGTPHSGTFNRKDP